MSTPNKHCTVRLDRRKYDRIVVLAAEQKRTPSDLIRSAVDGYLATQSLDRSSQRRLARISEFQQLALDIIIREQFPEYRDRIIVETDRRMEQYHGA